MKPTVHRSQREAGVLLIEVLLAVMLFGLAALGLMKALNAASQAANASKMDLRMLATLQSTLTQYSRTTRVEETQRPIVSEPDELGVWTETVIREMNEKNGELLQTDESPQGGRQQLQQMFHIIVTAYWEADGQKGEMSADTYRYAPLYRPTQTQ
ncbi:MAG: type IV pilus modification PilV family protein [Verrucomicrobiales bacterium]